MQPRSLVDRDYLGFAALDRRRVLVVWGRDPVVV